MEERSPARRMTMSSRQDEIVALVKRRGFASIEAMSERFAVSSQTIRRDIKDLCARDLLIRYHGGAGLPADADKLAYPNRRIRFAAEKRRIAALIAEQIPNGSSLFIDIGTTTEAVAKALLEHEGLRIVTNHIAVVSIFCEHSDFEIVLAGGLVRNRDRAIIGGAAADFLKNFRVSYGIFGIGAIHADGQMLDYDYRDVQVSLTAMQISRRRFVVADRSKFNGDAMVALGPVSDVDALFTDAPPPAEIERALTAAGVELFVAPEGGLEPNVDD